MAKTKIDKKYVVTGGLLLQAKLKKFPFVVQKKMVRRAIIRIMKSIVLPDAKRRAPYDASNDDTDERGREMHLRDSLKIRALRRTRTRVGRAVQTVPKEGENPRKGAYQEFGTRTGSPKHMYARKAIYANEKRIRNILKKELKKVIREEHVRIKAGKGFKS